MEDLARVAARRLPTRWAARPLVLKSETVSTNDDARAAAVAGAPHGYTVVADAQSGGRGRRGRVWHSPPGENLYLSLVARPRLMIPDAPLLTLAAGLAVADTLDTMVAPGRVTIKWPNDVRTDGRKVAGVLVEGSARGAVLSFAIVGIGVNVRGTTLPEQLAPIATTVRLATGAEPDRGAVLAALLGALEARIDLLLAQGGAPVVAAVSARCDTLGTRVRVDEVVGTARAITSAGGLLVARDDGTEVEVRAGEVASPYAMT
jgi:BirA family biotin operon repressor/biotin-[acetyl-CoA-carboxylase] ligase